MRREKFIPTRKVREIFIREKGNVIWPGPPVRVFVGGYRMAKGILVERSNLGD